MTTQTAPTTTARWTKLATRPGTEVDLLTSAGQFTWKLDLDLHNAENELRSLADQARRELYRLVAALDAGHHVNEYGVLQGTGRNVDSLCGKREWMATQLTAAIVIAGEQGHARTVSTGGN